MKYIAILCTGMSALSLSACGGSGGGVIATPLPPPAQRNSSLTNLTVNDEFNATAQRSVYTVSKTNGSATVSNQGGQGYGLLNTTVTYDAASKGYTVSLGAPNPSFNQSQRVAASSNGVITVYEKASGNQNESFVLFNPGPANTELALTYTSYGAYQILSDNGSDIGVNSAFFAFGIATTAADMPRTGVATYKTLVDGQYADASGVYALTGTSQFSANFANSTFSYTLNPLGTNVLNGSGLAFGSFSGGGNILTAEAAFRQTGIVRTATHSVSLNGYFYGPGAAEIGGSFGLESLVFANPGVGSGILIGKKN